MLLDKNMDINDLRIEYFDPEKGSFFVDVYTEYGRKIIDAFRENIQHDEKIEFCVLTTKGSILKKREMGNIYGDGNEYYYFFCLALLHNRIIIVAIHYEKFFGVTFNIMTDVIMLNQIDSIVIEQQGTGYCCRIETITTKDPSRFFYKTQYHQFLLPYINQIKEAIKQQDNIKTDNDFLSELESLVTLRLQGYLSEEEFITAKRKLLS